MAGSSPERIVEIHGTIQEVMCMACDERAPMERALARVRAGEVDPPCRSCGGILKSATISFGQNLVTQDLMRCERVAQECDLMLAVGSTLAVYPVAGVVPIAKESGARIAILNGADGDGHPGRRRAAQLDLGAAAAAHEPARRAPTRCAGSRT